MQNIEELPAPKVFGEAAFEDQETNRSPAVRKRGRRGLAAGCPRRAVAPISESAFSAEEIPSAPADEALPEVITADMLRARMAKRKEASFTEADIEVPAELLAGIDEDSLKDDEEWIDESMGARGGKRKKAKGPAAKPAKQDKKKAPKKRGWGDEDDFSW